MIMLAATLVVVAQAFMQPMAWGVQRFAGFMDGSVGSAHRPEAGGAPPFTRPG
jgi:hypothetical protein